MSLFGLALLTMAVLAAGYLGYGRFIARQYRLDDRAVTPAVAKADGVDFIPTRPFYLMGQHFSAIAAAGPIVGPIAACMAFGWLPCVLWILIGVVFIGAVHDFSALVASVRHGAHSIAEIAKHHLGLGAFRALVAFIWLALLYVIVSFTDVTASTFLGRVEELEDLASGGTLTFNAGGAVAASSTLYLALAMVMGLVMRFLKPPLWLASIIFVPATLAVVWAGTALSHLIVFDPAHERTIFYTLILVYCFAASLLPVWILQQPRGFLGGFVLYLAIAVGVVGMIAGGFDIQQPMLADNVARSGTGLWDAMVGSPDAPPLSALLFPFLFVTIACGACSGFHGLVCGGTTSKQIERESHCTPVGFGCMLLEGFVAIIALATVVIVAPADAAGKPPPVIYGEGIARFVTIILGPEWLLFAKTFGTMAVATFVFDTLDVATRLGRYLIQELLGSRRRAVAWAASLATVLIPLLILLSSDPGAWRTFWTMFGTANQLLAALTLLGITVWLRRHGKRSWYTLYPMLFVMLITLTALTLQVLDGLRLVAARGLVYDPKVLNAAVGSVLLALALFFIVQALRSSRLHTRTPA
ncbi:MAG: carbon starvation protein A [Phycisphaeraceae bacterium]|nr:MAG: carbon starvation protein A [Phycisphaeraceae bacterium]